MSSATVPARAGLAALLAATLFLPMAAGAAGEGRLASEARKASGAPALAAAVITSDSIDVYASGRRRAGSPDRITHDDAFAIGSDAKAMLATLIAQEIERGRLRWDTTIEEVLPDAIATARTEYRAVTIAELLDHRSGLVPLVTRDELVRVPRFRGSVVSQRRQAARWALRQPPVAVPGAATVYSNAGYVVAAAMLERVPRPARAVDRDRDGVILPRPLEQLLQRRLLDPLGMHASFGWPGAARPMDAPWGHEMVDGRLVAVHPADEGNRMPGWINPAGNLSLGTRDFARFVQLHLRGLRGTATLLDTGTFLRMHTPPAGFAYTSGWAVIGENGQQISFHEGNSGLFYAFMIVDAQHDVAAVVVANADTPQVAEAATTLAIRLMQAKVQP